MLLSETVIEFILIRIAKENFIWRTEEGEQTACASKKQEMLERKKKICNVRWELGIDKPDHRI